MARVVGGRDFVGSPGAPGWTTTGGAGLACWAKAGALNRDTMPPAARIMFRTTRPVLNRNHVMTVDCRSRVSILTKAALHEREVP